MTLYGQPDDPYTQRCLVVLAEKRVAIDTVRVDEQQPPEDLLDLNPRGLLPTLVDRDLVLTDANIIMEFIDGFDFYIRG